MYIPKATFSKIKHYKPWIRCVLVNLILNPLLEDDDGNFKPRPFTDPYFTAITGVKWSQAMQKTMKKFSSVTGMTVKVKIIKGKNHIVEQDLGSWSSFAHEILWTKIPIEDRVCERTGLKFASSKKSQTYSQSDHFERVNELLCYLNQNRNTYRGVERYILELKDQVKKLNLSDHAKMCQLANIEHIHHGAQPKYKQVDKSPRIYQDGLGLASLKRSLRKMVAKQFRWVGLDLTFAHLAIISKLWGANKLNQFLESGGDWWQYLEVNLPFYDKDCCKESTYCLVYGGSLDRNTKGGLKKIWMRHGRPQDREVFLNLTLVKDLVKARERKFESVCEDFEITTAFGTTRYLNHKRGVTERSLMSYEVQSFEVLIMLAAFDAIKDERDYRITLWLHDGIYLGGSLTDERIDSVVSRMQKAVEVVARRLGVPTKLEAKD